METCLGFHIDCGILVKGVGVTLMAFILFVGSVYLILTAVFGRWMAYLVVMVTLAGWLIVLSALWAFGFYSQGPDTPVNLGPRGAEPAWVPLLASTGETSDRYEAFRGYPGAPWKEPAKSDTADVQSVSGIVTEFLAEEANAELEIDPLDPTALTGVDFALDKLGFANRRGHEARRRAGPLSDGGRLDGVALLRQGSVPTYSYMFHRRSIVLFGIQSTSWTSREKKRKDFLTHGAARPGTDPHDETDARGLGA